MKSSLSITIGKKQFYIIGPLTLVDWNIRVPVFNMTFAHVRACHGYVHKILI